MPLQATSGAASYDAFGGGVAAVPQYIEDVFSTWLYTGNDSTQTITNGIDLAGKGGLVWVKARNEADSAHRLFDTNRGTGTVLFSNLTNAATTATNQINSFNSTGFTLGTSLNTNQPSINYASWTFRKQPKFFDVVTWTGDGAAQKTIAHNLGSAPGFIIAKSTSDDAFWTCYHRSLGEGKYIRLNTTGAQVTSANAWININASTFDAYDFINQSGSTYVAYVFAHNAGGFGLTGTDNVISCGSYTGNGSATGPVINLGYEPQWVMIKNTTTGGLYYDWYIQDSMRGFGVDVDGQGGGNLNANTSEAQELGFNPVMPTATGFKVITADVVANKSGDTFIYIAIRRGPMKVPTTGTSVFALGTSTSDSSGYTLTSNFAVDSYLYGRRSGASHGWMDRLTNARLFTTSTSAEGSTSGFVFWDSNVNVRRTGLLGSASTVDYAFRRAPGFFDEVCYTGDGNLAPPPSDFKVAHNLTVRPEMVIIKRRNGTSDWNPAVAISSTQWVNGPTTGFGLNRTDPADTPFNFSTLSYATATTFSPAVVAGNTGGGFSGTTNDSGATYVAYLFASCPGVSKVGSYTGTGATQTINCGFTGGARFVLIKAASTTGNWLVWDTARGMIPSNDPYLALNSTAAEVTGTDWVDTAATGFELSNAGGNLANSNGVTYIFLAIA